jgi:hypothetical protein
MGQTTSVTSATLLLRALELYSLSLSLCSFLFTLTCHAIHWRTYIVTPARDGAGVTLATVDVYTYGLCTHTHTL